MGAGSQLPAGGQEEPGPVVENPRDLFVGADEQDFQGLPHHYATTLNKGHGRIGRRECWTISDPACLE